MKTTETATIYRKNMDRKFGVATKAISDSLAVLNVLLIDNGSDTLKDYLMLLNKHKVKIISFRDIEACEFDNYQLIILSDGHSLNVSENTKEIDLVRHTSIPVIGICYGFQILCLAYGAELVKLSEKREGLAEVVSKSKHPIFRGKEIFFASEKHRFSVQSVSGNLSCLAQSKDGCEVVQVRGKQQFGFQFHPEDNNLQNEGREIFDNLVRFIFS